MNNQLSRAFSLVVYDTYETLEKVLSAHDVICAYFIMHDKDEQEDGTIKKYHGHMYLYVKNATTATAVQKWFKDYCKDNVMVEVVRNSNRAIRYLIHLDDPDKHQYGFNEVVMFGNRDYFYRACREVSSEYDSSFLAMCDMLNGKGIFACAKRYGRDFIYHYTALREVVRDLMQDPKSYSGIADVMEIDCDEEF